MKFLPFLEANKLLRRIKAPNTFLVIAFLPEVTRLGFCAFRDRTFLFHSPLKDVSILFLFTVVQGLVLRSGNFLQVLHGLDCS